MTNAITANFQQVINDTEFNKIRIYFKVEGVKFPIEVTWSNEAYIQRMFDKYGVNDADGLSAVFTQNPVVDIWEYTAKSKKTGKEMKGYTLEEPFPTPSEPTQVVVEGTLKQVRDTGMKVAFVIDSPKGDFIVTRSYYEYDPATKTSFPTQAKFERLAKPLGVVDSFTELEGKKVQAIRMQAGANYYYEVTLADDVTEDLPF